MSESSSIKIASFKADKINYYNLKVYVTPTQNRSMKARITVCLETFSLLSCESCFAAPTAVL